MPPVRALAAILFADAVGYSRLMGADEEGTHERVQAHFRELFDPKIAEHTGHVVNKMGDGILAQFLSVVEAVRCAVEIQHLMLDREAGIPEERRLGFRGEDLVQPCDTKSIAKLVVTEVSDAALRGCTGRVQCPEIGTRSPGRFR
jgi:hypothetical protein